MFRIYQQSIQQEMSAKFPQEQQFVRIPPGLLLKTVIIDEDQQQIPQPQTSTLMNPEQYDSEDELYPHNESILIKVDKLKNSSTVQNYLGSFSCLEILYQHLQTIKGNSKWEGRMIYMGNIVDLWKYLGKKIRQQKAIASHFSKTDHVIISRSIILARAALYTHLKEQIDQYYSTKKYENQGKNNQEKLSTMKKMKVIEEQIKRIKLNKKFNNSNISQSKIFTDVLSQIDYAEMKQLSSEDIKKQKEKNKKYVLDCHNDLNNYESDKKSLINRYLQKLLMHLYKTVRKEDKMIEQKDEKGHKQVNILCLVVVYIRIFQRNPDYAKIKETKFQVQTLYMRLMGQRKGIPQLIKFLEDGHPIAIEKQYKKTKEELIHFNQHRKLKI